MADVAAGDLRYTFGTFPVIWGMPVQYRLTSLGSGFFIPLFFITSGVTYLGVRTGDMLPENASALVGAAVITVAVFPVLALLLRAKGEGAQPEGVVAIAVHRAADLASAQFYRFTGFLAQKSWRKRDS